MVYINTTGKHNEVWLDKPYATITVECPDCPSTEDAYSSGWTDGSEDGYHKGYQSGYTDGFEACSAETCEGVWEDGYDTGFMDGVASVDCSDSYNSGVTDGFGSGYTSGVTDQKAKLTVTSFTENNTYTRENGWSAVTVNVPQTGQTINNQTKSTTIYKKDVELVDAGWGSYTYRLKDNIPYVFTYDSGYTGLESAEVNLSIDARDAITQGRRIQLEQLSSTSFTQNGDYTRENGWSSVTVSVSGYTQEDLEAAFASGYSAGLRDCSGYTPSTGDSVLDFVYETTEPNQTISLFHGDAPNNGWFELFFSALTAIEIGGVSETPDASNIQVRNSVSSYTHTFATAGKHQVKFTVSDDYTDALGHNPARMLKQLLFSLELDGNLNNLCPLVEANIGEGYEVIYFGAFTDQHGLTGLTLPDTLTTLSGYPFEATGLIDVTIPENVTAIGHKSFYNCSAITAMTFEGLTPPVLSGTEPLGSTAYTFPIYVPASAVSAYQNEPSWADYASRVQAKP